jgi:hypothetical protein
MAKLPKPEFTLGHFFDVELMVEYIAWTPPNAVASPNCRLEWSEKADKVYKKGMKKGEWFDLFANSPRSGTFEKWMDHMGGEDKPCPGRPKKPILLTDTPYISPTPDDPNPKRVMFFTVALHQAEGCPCKKKDLWAVVATFATQRLEWNNGVAVEHEFDDKLSGPPIPK